MLTQDTKKRITSSEVLGMVFSENFYLFNINLLDSSRCFCLIELSINGHMISSNGKYVIFCSCEELL